jgi:hypothetical protein
VTTPNFMSFMVDPSEVGDPEMSKAIKAVSEALYLYYASLMKAGIPEDFARMLVLSYADIMWESAVTANRKTTT